MSQIISRFSSLQVTQGYGSRMDSGCQKKGLHCQSYAAGGSEARGTLEPGLPGNAIAAPGKRLLQHRPSPAPRPGHRQTPPMGVVLNCLIGAPPLANRSAERVTPDSATGHAGIFPAQPRVTQSWCQIQLTLFMPILTACYSFKRSPYLASCVVWCSRRSERYYVADRA